MAEKEYIEREAFKRKLIDEKSFFPAIVASALKEMPAADVVEVVRCRDCKHRNPYGSKCLRDNLWHDPDGYCSYGERREQG